MKTSRRTVEMIDISMTREEATHLCLELSALDSIRQTSEVAELQSHLAAILRERTLSISGA